MKRYGNKNDMPAFVAVLLLLLIIGSAVAIYFIKDFSKIFLLTYLVPLIIIFAYIGRIPKTLGGISRTLLGALFVFSGFVKGVDPLGFSYKVEDYLVAYNMPWFLNMALALAVLACLVEFITGIMLLFNIKVKISLSIATLMMIGFTVLTLIDALTNKVPDCGCFGEAVKLSNWQTLYKNLTLDLLVLVTWLAVKKMKPTFYSGAEWGITCVTAVVFVGFQLYNIAFLPVIDFRDWKVGNKMTLDNPEPVEYFVEYVNNETGEIISMRSDEIPYDSTEWMTQWSFKDQKIVDNNKYPHNLMLFSANGSDETAYVLGLKSLNILIVSTYIEEMNMKHLPQIKKLIAYCIDNGYEVSFITSSDYETYEAFAAENDIDAVFYNADDIELKSMIRSNPGIIAMENGVVMGKWSHNRVPGKLVVSGK
ncbi:MAG: hypothetical protein PHR20_05560 [Bacteroidales bacterium]|nr:hypothetical protein [Bacteroidales bacterium]